jgi:uncharacterized phage protein gp47/JayE
MPLNIPSTQTVADRNLTLLESQLNQQTPANKRSFVRVLAKVLALGYTELYKLAVERSLQTLAITASGDGLVKIGNQYAVTRNPAVSAVLTIIVEADTDAEVPSGTYFIGNPNNIRYASNYSVVEDGDIATLNITAETPGAIGNLTIGDTLVTGSRLPGIGSVATVTAVVTTGAEEENLESYRQRVLAALRAVLGGGNAADYRSWGTEVSGVQQCYPYSGKPSDSPPSYPGDRTVFVEAAIDVDADGIAPSSLLDSVRAAINADPDTGVGRPPLGLTDDTLYVQSITRSSFSVTINGLSVSADSLVEAKEDLTTFLEYYFLSVRPFVEAIDVVTERNDVLTNLTISKIVQDVLSTFGGSAESVEFGLYGDSAVDSYTLSSNEKAKLVEVLYA